MKKLTDFTYGEIVNSFVVRLRDGESPFQIRGSDLAAMVTLLQDNRTGDRYYLLKSSKMSDLMVPLFESKPRLRFSDDAPIEMRFRIPQIAVETPEMRALRVRRLRDEYEIELDSFALVDNGKSVDDPADRYAQMELDPPSEDA